MLAGIVLLGSSVQWLTGMGFALVAVPALVLVLGPAEGVVLANCAAGIISAVGLADGWRRVRLAAMVPLCVAAVCTVPAGTWVARRLSEPALMTAMGVLVTVAVVFVMRGARVTALRGGGGALGPVVKLPPAPRRLARTLAALPKSPSSSATRTSRRLAIARTRRRGARPPGGRREFDDRAKSPEAWAGS
ncbi:sulfite exporter TauE/SafE family protein [Streptomyces bluensis]|uniref:Probable membrane transporter protein n=1 Tax=Streptomyces bluensis TaxID=33897 RepID=A0ABW6UDR0_9ACTN